MLYHSHTPPLTGHPGHRYIYDTLLRFNCWAHIGSEAYATIPNYESCEKQENRQWHRRKIKLIPETGPLKFVAMDEIEPLPEKTRGNPSVLEITD